MNATPFLAVALSVCLAHAAIAADSCPSPIIPGRWKLATFKGATELHGTWTADGAVVTVNGKVEHTGNPDAGFLTVDCDGNVTGAGTDTIAGQIVNRGEVAGFTVLTTGDYSGSGNYTITGVVVQGPTGLVVNATWRMVSGTQRSVVTTEAPFAPTQRHTETIDLSGQTVTTTFPVKRYDPDAGILELDFKESPFVQAMQANVDAILGGHPLDVTYSGEAHYENKTPSIVTVVPEFTQNFLLDVSAQNTFTATINWRGAPGARKVHFTYGADTQTVEASGATVSKAFDMKEAHTSVTVVAEAGTERSQPVTVSFGKVSVPEWIGGASQVQGSAGIDYQATLDWPVPPTFTETISDIPIVGGLWGAFGSFHNDLKIKAHSNGQVGVDRLDGALRFKIPFTSADLNLNLDGQTRTTLTASELKMEGDAQIVLGPWSHQKTISVLDLIRGSEQALCSISQEVCDIVRGVGIHASLSVSLTGNGKYESSGADIKWTDGSATGTLRAHALLNLISPPLDAIISVSVQGGGTGCLTVKVLPDWEIERLAGQLDFSASASAMFIGSASISKTWPFNGGCGGLSAASIELPRDGEIPLDAQAAFALTAEGARAAAWNQIGVGRTRPSGDIVGKIKIGETWTSFVVTDDAAPDHAPSIAFDNQNRLIIVWQRNAVDLTGEDGLAPFSSGFEIEYAVVEATTLNGQLSISVTQRGQLTANAQPDIAPRLVRSAEGGLMLVWLRSSGNALFGNAGSPAALMTRFWNGSQWSSELRAADNLSGIAGWSGALANSGAATIAFTRDMDANFASATDKELFTVTFANGQWTTPQRLTENAQTDWGPRLTYLADGRLAAGWMRDDTVVGFVGAGGVTRTWFTNSFGDGFSSGELLSSGNELIAVWPTASGAFSSGTLIDAAANRDNTWSTPAPLRLSAAVDINPRAVITADGSIEALSLSAPVFGDVPQLARSGNISVIRSAPVLSGDTDGDGMLDADELLAGTDPANALSLLKIQAHAVQGDRLELRWSSIPARQYEVQSSTDLRAWTRVADIPSGGLETSATAPIEAGARYFRIVVK